MKPNLWIRRIFITLGSLYLIAVGLLLLFENYLIYPGRSPRLGAYDATFEFEDVYFTAEDGTKLHGWMIPFTDGDTLSDRYVLYCHGNGENVSGANGGVAKVMGETMKANMFIFDYRGYGKSEGKSNEVGIKSDTDAAMNWLCQRFQIQPTDVIVEGFSIGGGPAVYVGTGKGCKGMILQRTFTSLPDVAAEKHPWAPVRLLMRNRFDSASLIADYQGPLLQSHGGKDQVIPFKFGKRLHDTCPSDDKQFFTRPDMDHFSYLDPEFLKMAATFADRLYDQ
ncbi:alpha/beta hydrolase [bacterium]|nr:alpha/beta hydrolase [bacterium]